MYSCTLFVKNIVLLEHILAILENDLIVWNNLSTRSGFYGLHYEFMTQILWKIFLCYLLVLHYVQIVSIRK